MILAPGPSWDHSEHGEVPLTGQEGRMLHWALTVRIDTTLTTFDYSDLYLA